MRTTSTQVPSVLVDGISHPKTGQSRSSFSHPAQVLNREMYNPRPLHVCSLTPSKVVAGLVMVSDLADNLLGMIASATRKCAAYQYLLGAKLEIYNQDVRNR